MAADQTQAGRTGGSHSTPGTRAAPALGGRRAAGAVAAIAVAVGAAVVLARAAPGADTAAGAEAALLVTLAAATAVLVPAARRSRAPHAAWLTAAGTAAATAVQIGAWADTLATGRAPDSDAAAATLAVLLAAALAAGLVDFLAHVRDERAETATDIALVAATLGGGAYLALVHAGSPHGSGAGVVLTGALVGVAALAVAARVVLALWIPSRRHLWLVAGVVAVGGAAVALAWTRVASGAGAVSALPLLVTGAVVAGLGVVAFLSPGALEGARPGGVARSREWWIRPSLLTATLVVASVILGVALLSSDRRGATEVAGGLIALIAVLVAVRLFVSHGAVARATSRLGTALAEREEALASLGRVAEEARTSEARLRLLVDAAVDGVVELDGRGIVVRANGAFCEMVRLRLEDVVGHAWEEVARAAAGGGPSLEELPSTGQAELVREGRTTFLEARVSLVPVDPPGTLLLVRDVTASRVTDQTIRTLFQFLQDRDEDRTRLFRRTNAAIEAERNRIARDLHDGPIQGISAAALSLEAVRMMLAARDLDGAGDMIGKIRRELSEEAHGLRRLMSNLRPPLLEERGLLPALRELCERFQADRGIEVRFQGTTDAPVPTETEILAYRIVQEALSNIGKHAEASRVQVGLTGTGGVLDIEVTDDGRGFDPGEVRSFLRRGKVGLASMRERTELCAGTFTIRSEPGNGTSVRATVPFEVLGATRTIP